MWYRKQPSRPDVLTVEEDTGAGSQVKPHTHTHTHMHPHTFLVAWELVRGPIHHTRKESRGEEEKRRRRKTASDEKQDM